MRTIVAVALLGAVLGSAEPARGEVGALLDSGTCFGATSCGCGYVCVTGYCQYRGADAVPSECSTDADCRPECSSRVCVDRRCVPRSPVDVGETDAVVPPPDRPSSEDRIDDVGRVIDGAGEAPSDRPATVPDRPALPPARDAGVVDVPPRVVDAGVALADVPPVDDASPDEPSGTLVQGCGCTIAGATPARPWWVLGLVAWALRPRRKGRRTRGSDNPAA